VEITLYNIGKTNSAQLIRLSNEYSQRINRFVRFTQIDIPDVRKTKNMPSDTIMKKEGDKILQAARGSYMVLLDERGKQFTSREFSVWLESKMSQSIKHLAFITGGAWGVSEEVRQAAHLKIALSKMTFTHELARLVFIEQFYRALTILNNLPYHND
jgi:23S rRNA (pseudouridine1915-N3)-methyltransferase